MSADRRLDRRGPASGLHTGRVNSMEPPMRTRDRLLVRILAYAGILLLPGCFVVTCSIP